MTKRALVTGRIIKHNGHALVVMRGPHATGHGSANGVWTTLDALDDAAKKLVAHSRDYNGTYDYATTGRRLD